MMANWIVCDLTGWWLYLWKLWLNCSISSTKTQQFRFLFAIPTDFDSRQPCTLSNIVWLCLSFFSYFNHTHSLSHSSARSHKYTHTCAGFGATVLLLLLLRLQRLPQFVYTNAVPIGLKCVRVFNRSDAIVLVRVVSLSQSANSTRQP